MLGSVTWAAENGFPVVRTPEAKRKFKSRIVERTIEIIKERIGNKELAWMFENCFPNTLDTTVDFEVVDGRPDTYVITGDIDAMWLRDSTAQVWPYLPLMKNDSNLQQLIAGVINRHSRCILKDPYANAFYKDETKVSEWKSDRTEMKPGVHERKWEIDSLCYPIRLAYHYWKLSNDRAPLDAAWRDAILLTLKTFREQQRMTSQGPYRFQRRTETQTDTLAGGGYGRPVKPVGLICSMFRPSDDSTVFPFLVPSNFFAVVSLRQAADLLSQIHQDQESAAQCRALADEVERALRQYAVVIHEKHGRIAAPAPRMAPTLRTTVRTLLCFAGAIAAPAGWAAVTPLTLGASAAAVPTGLCRFSSCLSAGRESDDVLVGCVCELCCGAVCDFAHITPGLSGSSPVAAGAIAPSRLVVCGGALDVAFCATVSAGQLRASTPSAMARRPG